MRKLPFALLALALLTQAVQADIYKCRLANGSMEFSNSPCAGNSSTLKTLNAEIIPEESRREAERKVERMRDEADKLETRRRAEETAERQEQEHQRPPTGPSATQVQECLGTVARLSLDSARRAELEATCHANGVVQPVYVPVPVPYHTGPGYVRPRHAQPLPTPQKPEAKPQPKPEPLPQPTKPASKTNGAYTPPSSFKPH